MLKSFIFSQVCTGVFLETVNTGSRVFQALPWSDGYWTDVCWRREPY